MNKVFIVAEAGVNHNGSIQLAMRLVDCAKKTGADAVKFQTFKADFVASNFAPKAQYQKGITGKNESQLEMLRKLELKDKDFFKLAAYCKKRKIVFLSSAFDLKSVDLLAGLGMTIFKIPSGEINNFPFLRKIGSLKKKVIISTGMSTINDIRRALVILVRAGTIKKNITVLHCNTEYPTPVKDVNLRAMLTIKEKLGVQIGYSDHTLGFETAIAAVVLGATVLEKHLTLDKDMSGPDHKASLEPIEFEKLVLTVRNVEKAMGTGIKKPSISEYENRAIVRKSLVAAKAISKGEKFTPDNVTVKRPGTGLSPMLWDDIIGRKSKNSFKKDELIKI